MSPSGSSSAEAELSIVELLEAELRYVNQQLQKSHQQLLRQSELQLDNEEIDDDEETDPELLTSHMNLVDFISRTRQEIESRMTALRPKMKEFKSRSELNRLQVHALKEKVKHVEDVEKRETDLKRQVGGCLLNPFFSCICFPCFVAQSFVLLGILDWEPSLNYQNILLNTRSSKNCILTPWAIV